MGPGETNRKKTKENHEVRYKKSPTLKDGTEKEN